VHIAALEQPIAITMGIARAQDASAAALNFAATALGHCGL
jgi:hypothetical protein